MFPQRQVSREISKKESNVYKKRADRKYLRGRTYKDYKAYMDKNPDAFVIQKIEKDKVILKPYLLKNNISQMTVSINITHLEMEFSPTLLKCSSKDRLFSMQ